MMGLEEHLIGMFRGDAEFHEDAAPSHLGGGVSRPASVAPEAAEAVVPEAVTAQADAAIAAAADSSAQVVATWAAEAERELRKIPFFVRGKARRNTETYARDKGLPVITLETLYDAKAHFSR
jgi:light-independent protochlorophyllide reductase subunit B